MALSQQGEESIARRREERRRLRELNAQRRDAGADQASDAVDWQDVAKRLRAEMDNYRKRQKRWAQDEIVQEKARLLGRFFEVTDNLEHALEHVKPDDPAHQGLQMAYDSMLNLLLREGVERIFAMNRAFDPALHEAIAMVPAPPDQDIEMKVVEVMAPGYRFEDRVLRPAKVVVAKREA